MPQNWSRTQPGLTLTNANLTASIATGGTAAGFECFGGISDTTNKYYWEIIFDSLPDPAFGGTGAGLGNTSSALGAFLGQNDDTIGYYNNDGSVSNNSVNLVFIQTFAQGDRVGTALDLVNSKVWFRVNGGNWNNDVIGNQNPATNIGGISIAIGTVRNAPIVPAINLIDAGGQGGTNQTTGAFIRSSWSAVAPAGFNEWGNLDVGGFGSRLYRTKGLGYLPY